MKYVKSAKLPLIFLFTLTLVSALIFNNWVTSSTAAPEAPVVTGLNERITADSPPTTTAAADNDHTAATEAVHNEPETKAEVEAEPKQETEIQAPAAQEKTVTAKQPAVERNIQLADRKGTKTAVAKDSTEKATQVDAPAPPAAPQPNNADTDLNSYVHKVIAAYPLGNYPYLLNNDYRNYNGVTENLYYQGSIIAKAHPSGNRASHCSGITFEVFFKAMQARNRKLGLPSDDFNGMTFGQLQDFQMHWYVANGSKSSSNLAVAVEKYGLGKQIHNWEDAKKGDFLDFSRTNNTGHTVVFLNWERNENGKINGLHYWSSQGSTNGINYVTEYFDFSGRGNVISNQIYLARVLPVKQYK